MRLWLIVAALFILLIAFGNLAIVGVLSRHRPENRPLALSDADRKEAVAPYVATPPEVVQAMLQTAEVKPGELVADLGCGDARILVAAARDYHARGFGVELDPQVLAMAADNARRNNVSDSVQLVRGNLFDADIHSADVVALYLLPETLERLRPILLAQLRPGVRVVTHDFPIAGWREAATRKVARGDGTFHTVHLYRIGQQSD